MCSVPSLGELFAQLSISKVDSSHSCFQSIEFWLHVINPIKYDIVQGLYEERSVRVRIFF
jgi:hypothetical protein